jgi:apolipoprotein N-acyltransferase
LRPLAPLPRLALALAGWLLLFAASPGVLGRDGSLVLAVLGLALWGSAVVREPAAPERRRARWLARGAEYAPAVLGSGALQAWIAYVTPAGLVALGLVHGLYALLAGRAVRLLRARLGPALAIALGWWSVEILRELTLGWIGGVWMRLGTYAHHHAWLAPSARWLGPEGVGLCVALAGGWLGARLAGAGRPLRELVPPALACGLAALASAREPLATDPGPLVLLVQPGFPQARKQFDDPWENFSASRALTLEALRSASEPPDLVAWGETMLYIPLAQDLESALERGARTADWEEPFDAGLVRRLRSVEDDWVRRGLLAELPAGTAFASGAEVYHADEQGSIRRWNAVVLYDERGERQAAAPKSALVPGAETMFGLERYAVVRALAKSMAGYVPDFVPARRTGVLAFHDRAGRELRFSATVCFDNAYLHPYVDALRREPLDFHLVVSNEAWYRESFEMDQMVAFSRLIALSTERAVVRATNSGVSVVLAPDGRELARVEEGGRDRSLAGTCAARVPVPRERDRLTPYVRWGRKSVLTCALAVVVLAFVERLRRRAARA